MTAREGDRCSRGGLTREQPSWRGTLRSFPTRLRETGFGAEAISLEVRRSLARAIATPALRDRIARTVRDGLPTSNRDAREDVGEGDRHGAPHTTFISASQRRAGVDHRAWQHPPSRFHLTRPEAVWPGPGSRAERLTLFNCRSSLMPKGSGEFCGTPLRPTPWTPSAPPPLRSRPRASAS